MLPMNDYNAFFQAHAKVFPVMKDRLMRFAGIKEREWLDYDSEPLPLPDFAAKTFWDDDDDEEISSASVPLLK